MSSTDTAENNITQVRIDIGELKGILNTTVVTHSDKIRGLEQTQEKQRSDMNAVKDVLIEKINVVSTIAETNKNEIGNIRDDVKGIQEKQNGSFGKIAIATSIVLSLIGLFWNILSKAMGG